MSMDVIFIGLDGVLFDTESLHLEACNTAFAEAGLSLRWSLATLRAAAGAHGYASAIGAALERTPLAHNKHDHKQRTAALCEAKHSAFHALIAAKPPKALPAALALIDDALDAGAKICILTDLPAPATSALLDGCFGADVNSLFAVVTGGAAFDGPTGTGPYARALHAMGVSAGDAIAIDTAVPALRAAREAGLWTVSVAPYGEEVVRPRQFITFDALRELGSSPYTPDQRSPRQPQRKGNQLAA